MIPRSLLARLVPGLLVPLLGMLACAPTSLGPTSFATNYERVADRAQVSEMPPCATVKSIMIRDDRPDKNRAGSRAPEKHRAKKQPISFSGGAEHWLVSGVEDNLKLAGIRPNKNGRATIEVTLLDLELTEITSTRSSYSAAVTLDARVATETVGKGFRIVGTSKHSGESGRRKHYNETLNLALDGAMTKLMASADFSATLCAK